MNFKFITLKLVKRLINSDKFIQSVKDCEKKNLIPKISCKNILQFYYGFKSSVKEFDLSIFFLFLDLVKKQIENPSKFEIHHKKIRSPIDYFQFGIDFVTPLIDKKKSLLKGENNIEKIEQILSNNENIILFANHQSESDPQVISILLEKKYPQLAKKIIYVAGERVITDPLAIPFSMGCDLLCIYSKKHLNDDPDLKTKKQEHNRRATHILKSLLSQGGKIFYIAPSGGRDRMDKNGQIQISDLDSQSVELFYLISKKAKIPTHFFPLSLFTYNILPPPEKIEKEIGEDRFAKFSPAYLHFGKEIEMSTFSKEIHLNKQQIRVKRTLYIQNQIKTNYNKFF
jgi:glycerol-3-phosphate O-acyltransferase